MSREYPKEFLDLIKIDNKFTFYDKNNPNYVKGHIRAIVDERHIVYKTWFPHKKYWYYKCEGLYFFFLLWKAGEFKCL